MIPMDSFKHIKCSEMSDHVDECIRGIGMRLSSSIPYKTSDTLFILGSGLVLILLLIISGVILITPIQLHLITLQYIIMYLHIIYIDDLRQSPY